MIQDDALYQKLQTASGWSAQGDIVIAGEKYRRIKESDATYTLSFSAYYTWMDSTTYHYFKYQPVKWRVLSTDGQKAFLLADKALDDKRYHTSYTSVT